MMKLIRPILTVFLLSLASGCATMNAKDTIQPAEQLYNDARQAQADGNHSLAIARLKKLVANYPVSAYIQLASIEMAFAEYRLKHFDQAIASAESFITNNPNHKNIDYAYHIKGLSLSSQSIDEKNKTNHLINRKAYRTFAYLIQHYPKSKYKNDAKKQMGKLYNQLALNELDAVKKALEANKYDDAFKRAKYIAEHYPDAPAAADALKLVTQAAATQIQANNRQGFIKFSPPSDPLSTSRESWFMQQDPGNYTLQIAASSQRNLLKNIAKQHQLADQTTIYRQQQYQLDWYRLFHGSYRTWFNAIEAAELIKQQLGLKNVAIVQYKVLHNLALGPH